MSGGTFDYIQYRLHDIVERIEEEIKGNNTKPEMWFGEWTGQIYSDDTIREFKNGIDLLNKALVYAQRIDWLLAGDDGEETFHERLKNDLDELSKQEDEK